MFWFDKFLAEPPDDELHFKSSLGFKNLNLTVRQFIYLKIVFIV